MDSLPINGLDVVVVGVLLISGLLAFARGFVHEVLAMASWLAAAAVVILVLPYAKPIARQYITIPILADLAAAGLIFIISVILFSILISIIAGKIQASSLGPIDRSLGFAFGLARGALLVCLAYLPVQWLLPPSEQPAWLREARVLPLAQAGAGWLRSLVSDDIATRSATSATASSRERTRKALETDKMVRDMMSPEPKSPPPADPAQPKGYGDRERRELERLIGSDR